MNWGIYIIGAALALAIADILVKFVSGKIPDSLGMLLYGSVPFLAGLVWFIFDPKKALFHSPAAVLPALGVGVSFALVTFCMYAAFRHGAPISLASPSIRLGGLVLASAAGLIFWKEPLTLRYLLGLGLIAAGLYLMLTR
jgi:drug/metabolite transporter (DMT)-like permease